MTITTAKPAGLAVRDVTVRYGGLVAADAVTLDAPGGQITGLIGPNGAGKTTTFNACSGLVRPSDGAVLIDGVDVTGVPPAGRARLGLGRTFQRMQMFETLDVRTNVAMGREAGYAGRNPLRHVVGSRQQRRAVEEASRAALADCGLEDVADTPVNALPTGVRRLVELARVLAGEFRYLLLDEPSSGLDSSETDRFSGILVNAVEDRRLGILIVEHDMGLVLDVCDYVYVLDFGKQLFEGRPAEIRASPVVRAAYLGEDEV